MGGKNHPKQGVWGGARSMGTEYMKQKNYTLQAAQSGDIIAQDSFSLWRRLISLNGFFFLPGWRFLHSISKDVEAAEENPRMWLRRTKVSAVDTGAPGACACFIFLSLGCRVEAGLSFCGLFSCCGGGGGVSLPFLAQLGCRTEPGKGRGE